VQKARRRTIAGALSVAFFVVHRRPSGQTR
jgi:hypothetical protein